MSSSSGPFDSGISIPPLGMECRFPHICVAGCPTSFEIRLTGYHSPAVGKVTFDFSCDGLARGRFLWAHERLESGDYPPVGIALDPVREGAPPLNVKIEVSMGPHRVIGRGEIRPAGRSGLRILKNPGVPRDVRIQIGDRAFLGAILGSLNPKAGLLRFETLNDLLAMEIPCEFSRVDLNWEIAEGREEEPRRAADATAETPPLPLGSWKRVPDAGLLFLDAPVCQGLWREVTGEDFGNFLGQRDAPFAARVIRYLRAEMPVIGVQFDEAQEFCRKLERHCVLHGLLKRGWTVRLPSAREWEQARGPLPPPAELDRYCYNLALPRHRTRPPGPRSVQEMRSASPAVFPNRHELHGMFGDILEWCRPETADFHAEVPRAPVLGGSWHSADLGACQGGRIRPQPANKRSSRIGFRVVADFQDT